MQPGHEVNLSHPSGAKVKKEWSYTSTPPVSLHGMERNNLTIYQLQQLVSKTFFLDATSVSIIM
jgi:hypothetical protein